MAGSQLRYCNISAPVLPTQRRRECREMGRGAPWARGAVPKTEVGECDDL